MKKLHKLAAAVAVAAGIALSPQANAIELKPNGAGDALLFPIYYGQFENLFTITNNSGNWIQGHLRFRGATWSTELRDFDVILSPGDVFVFRLADLDGDGQWEIDQSLDTRNFQYTGMLFTDDCQGPNGAIPNCLNPSSLLEPTVFSNVTTQDRLTAQRNAGHVEFIGEAVLNGMTHAIMEALIGSNPGDTWRPYVTTNGNGRGTNAWKWSDAANSFRPCPSAAPCDRGLRDVPNVLTGTAFISYPGVVSALAYNADALTDFRTNTRDRTHRIENYPNRVSPNNGVVVGPALINTSDGANGVLAPTPTPTPPEIAAANLLLERDNSVIVHIEDASAAATYDYVYGFPGSGEQRRDEVVTSFNNTWGPSLADGDSYPLPAGNPRRTATPAIDVWDERFRTVTVAEVRAGGYPNYVLLDGANNATLDSGVLLSGAPAPSGGRHAHVDSIAEVETAIEEAGQVFYSYYFDKGNVDRSSGAKSYSLSSWFVGYAPTKFFYAEDIDAAAANPNFAAFVNSRVNFLSTLGKSVGLEVWNHEEVPCSGRGTISPSNANPSILGEEVSIWNITWMKGLSVGDKNCPNFTNGRVVVNAGLRTPGNPLYPFLLYTFEMSNDSKMYNMRAMQR